MTQNLSPTFTHMSNLMMTHLVAGYPDKETSEQILNLLCKYSRYVEVQIPFNDPIADGTVISDANNVAIGNNMNLE